MYRVSIKIERSPMALRRQPNTEETTPELLIQAKGKDIPDAIEKAIRHLTAELTSIREAEPVRVKLDDLDEEDED